MNNIAISLKNLNKTFTVVDNRKTTLRALVTSMFNQGRSKKFHALKNVNLEIRQGEFVGIVGRNGSGKSTLLKIIAGIYSSDRGSKVEVTGTLVPFLELGVGFNPDMSGRENVYLNGTILGMTRKYVNSKFDEIVEFAELGEFIEAPVKTYSSGMVVRLAFSIAIQADADIYILDEILSVGDAMFQKKCLKIINNLRNQKKTILYVTHSMPDIEKYCTRAIFLENREIVMDGTPDDVVDKYREANEKKIQQEFDKKLKKDSRDLKVSMNLTSTARIHDITIHDAKGGIVEKIEKGEDFIMKMKIKFGKKFNFTQPFNCQMALHSIEDNSVITAFSTAFEDLKVDLSSNPSEKTVEVRVKNNILRQGSYFASGLIIGEDFSVIHDALPYSNKFQVRERNKGKKIAGRIDLEHNWKLN